MDATIGRIAYGHKQVLHGDHHIVVTKRIKSAIGKLLIGLVLALDAVGDRIALALVSGNLTGTINGTNRVFTLASTNVRVCPGSITVTHGAQVAVDNGRKTFGGNAVGTVDYATGAVSVNFNAAPAAGSPAPQISYYPVPDSVLLEDVDTATVDAAPACVHGVVKRDVLVDAAGAAIPQSVADALAARGIYAV